MQEYFTTTPDPERGWALAALTGELSFAEAKPSQVRDLAISRVDPELFAWSLDFVGDLAETVALIWPEPDPSLRSATSPHPNPPPLAGEGVRRASISNPPPQAGEGRVGADALPTLTEIVATLRSASRAAVGAHLAPWLDALDPT